MRSGKLLEGGENRRDKVCEGVGSSLYKNFDKDD